MSLLNEVTNLFSDDEPSAEQPSLLGVSPAELEETPEQAATKSVAAVEEMVVNAELKGATPEARAKAVIPEGFEEVNGVVIRKDVTAALAENGRKSLEKGAADIMREHAGVMQSLKTVRAQNLATQKASQDLMDAANRHDNPTVADASAGLHDKLANKSDKRFTFDYKQIMQAREENVKFIQTIMEGVKSETSKTATTLQVLKNFALPLDTAYTIYALNEIDPEFKLSETFSTGEVIARVRERFVNMPPAELRKKFPAVVKQLRKITGADDFGGTDFFTGKKKKDTAQFEAVMKNLFGDITVGDNTSTLTSVLNTIDIVGTVLPVVGGVAGALASKVRKLEPKTAGGVALKKAAEGRVVGHQVGSPAHAASNTTKGQASLIEAAQAGDSAVLAKAGTTVEDVVDDAMLPNASLDDLPRSSVGFDEAYFTERELGILKETAGVRAVGAVARNMEEGATELTSRMKDTNIQFSNVGAAVVQRIGLTDGRGFVSEEAARIAATAVGKVEIPVELGPDVTNYAPLVADAKAQVEAAKKAVVAATKAEKFAKTQKSVDPEVLAAMPKAKTVAEAEAELDDALSMLADLEINGQVKKTRDVLLQKELSDGLGLPEGEFNIVKSADGDEWFIEHKYDYTYGTDGVLELSKDAVKSSGLFGRIFGNNARFTDEITLGGTWASRQTSATKAALTKHLRPYNKLAGKDLKQVNDLLQKYENVKYLTRDDMVELGLNNSQIKAMEAVYDASRFAYVKSNEWVYTKLVNEGYKEVTLNGKTAMVVAKVGTNYDFGPKVYDLATGTKMSRSAIPVDREGYTVYKVLGEAGEPRYAVLKKDSPSIEMREVSRTPVKRVEGYLPREYNQPFIIRALGEDGSSSAVATARTDKDAIAEVRRLNDSARAEWEAAGNEGLFKEPFVYRRAAEMTEQANDFDELDAIFEAGQMYTSTRNPVPLRDATGMDNMRPIAERIDSLVNSTSASVGVKRWAEVATARWNNMYAEKFGPLGIAKRDVAGVSTSGENIEETWQRAEALKMHIEMMTGQHTSQLANNTRAFRNTVADFLFKARLDTAAREVAGTDNALQQSAKKVTSAVLLYLNPVRQAVVQMSMSPTYVAVDGGLKYAASGKWARDNAVLSALVYGVSADSKAIKALGYTADEAQGLYDSWKKFGGGAFVEDNLFVAGQQAGILNKSASAGVGRVVRGVEAATQMGKAFGYDAATRVDKVQQFLVSRNRFLTQKGRLPQDDREWKGVLDFAESLGFNMNSSDPILSNQGVLALATQFASFGIKASLRMVGAEIGGKMTKAERARTAVATLGLYGTAGYGVKELVQGGLDSIGVTLNDSDRQALENGVNGYILDSFFNSWDNDEDEAPTAISSAESLSPYSRGFLGIKPDSVLAAFNGRLSMGHLLESTPFYANFPQIALGTRFYEAFKLSCYLVGNMDAPPSEKTVRAAHEMFKVFPLYSNAFMALVSSNVGSAVDRNGQPLVPTSVGNTLARGLLGMKSRGEVQLTAANTAYQGPFQDINSPLALNGVVKQAADDTATWLIPMFRGVADGKISRREAMEYVEKHGDMLSVGLAPEQRALYIDRLVKKIDEDGITKEARFAEAMAKDLKAGKVDPVDVIEIIDKFDLDGEEQAKVRSMAERWVQQRGE